VAEWVVMVEGVEEIGRRRKGRKCGAPAGAGLTRRQLNPSLCDRAFTSALRENGEGRAFLFFLPPFSRILTKIGVAGR